MALKGSRSHLQISLNVTELCKDEKYTVMMMYMNLIVVGCKILK